MALSPGGLEDRLRTLERQMREIRALLPNLARAGATGPTMVRSAQHVPIVPVDDDETTGD